MRDGDVVALGGWPLVNEPAALARAVIRAGRRGLTLLTPAGGFAADLLIGAGCVTTVARAALDLAPLGPAPAFARAAATGAIEVVELEVTTLVAALRAAAMSLSHAAIRPTGIGVAMLRVDDVRGDSTATVAALVPDVALVHAQQADYGGNAQMFGTALFDTLLARAARRVVVSADALVDYDALRNSPAATRLPEFLVDAVIEAPWGAHPTASAARYDRDDSHLRYYLEVSPDAGALATYARMFVTGPRDHDGYLEALGRSALQQLRR